MVTTVPLAETAAANVLQQQVRFDAFGWRWIEAYRTGRAADANAASPNSPIKSVAISPCDDLLRRTLIRASLRPPIAMGTDTC